jgi:hypothetical protein
MRPSTVIRTLFVVATGVKLCSKSGRSGGMTLPNSDHVAWVFAGRLAFAVLVFGAWQFGAGTLFDPFFSAHRRPSCCRFFANS